MKSETGAFQDNAWARTMFPVFMELHLMRVSVDATVSTAITDPSALAVHRNHEVSYFVDYGNLYSSVDSE